MWVGVTGPREVGQAAGEQGPCGHTFRGGQPDSGFKLTGVVLWEQPVESLS